MTAVWAVRPPVMTFQSPVRYFSEENIAREVLKSHHEFGIESTITRETLLTPAHAAVIEAAKAHIDDPELFDSETYVALVAAVATLRELEGKV